MNFLVILNSRAGELEKILSGKKSMLLKDHNPANAAAQVINPGDNLYFLRDAADCNLRVKATVKRVLTFTNQTSEGLSQILKEMQPRLQLTEAQYNEWSFKKQALLVEFCCAEKTNPIHVASEKLADWSSSDLHWTAFEVLDQIIE